jgi:7-cyano-7-deazaguanine reductase
MNQNPLGHQTEYVSQYAPHLLFPIARAESRKHLGLDSNLPFFGVDIWTGYELSWLNQSGKPMVAVAEFTVPCESEFIIESKSFKLYLNSFNQTRFANVDEVRAIVANDLSRAAHADISVTIFPAHKGGAEHLAAIAQPSAFLLDDLDVEIDVYHPAPELLLIGEEAVEETLVSHKGKRISRESMLRYLISFREHQDFHEHCVERIFCDIRRRCKPESLSVYARYTRRGGLDINPFRSTEASEKPASIRLVRQ